MSAGKLFSAIEGKAAKLIKSAICGNLPYTDEDGYAKSFKVTIKHKGRSKRLSKEIVDTFHGIVHYYCTGYNVDKPNMPINEFTIDIHARDHGSAGSCDEMGGPDDACILSRKRTFKYIEEAFKESFAHIKSILENDERVQQWYENEEHGRLVAFTSDSFCCIELCTTRQFVSGYQMMIYKYNMNPDTVKTFRDCMKIYDGDGELVTSGWKLHAKNAGEKIQQFLQRVANNKMRVIIPTSLACCDNKKLMRIQRCMCCNRIILPAA